MITFTTESQALVEAFCLLKLIGEMPVTLNVRRIHEDKLNAQQIHLRI